ncbi:MAG: allene oxide cyclase family protein [Solirubrobacteraceae bacterium]
MSNKAQGLGAFGIKTRIGLGVVAFAFAGWVAVGAPRIANAEKTRTTATRDAAGTVHVIEHAVTDTVIHSAGPGDVTGNLLTWHNKVYNPANVEQVGTDQGSCIRIAPAEGSWECNWTTFLKGGQITVQGPYYDTKNSVLSITGGTGAYSDARGEMNLISREGGTQYDFVFHLS